MLGDSEAITVYWSEGRETYYYILYIRNAYVHIYDVLRVASLPLSAVVRDVRYAAHAPKRSADSARGLHFVALPPAPCGECSTLGSSCFVVCGRAVHGVCVRG